MSFLRRVLNHFVPHHTNAYRPHILGRGWMVFVLAMVLATEGFLVASLVARQSGSSFLAAIIQSQLIDMTNQERSSNHVGTLAESGALDAAAQAKADDMAAKGYFAHQSPDGRQPWDYITSAGYDYQYAGENLAVRFVDSQDVVNAWMASPSHRANIVKPQYTEIGIGIAEGMYKGAPATFVVQYFASPSTAFAAREARTSAPKAPAGQVLGAATSPVSDLNSAVRQVPRFLGNPRSSVGWVLGGIAALLILIIGLAFVMHLQVQATDLLVPGMAVALVALCLLGVNSTLAGAGNQAASAASADQGGVVLTLEAAASTR